MTGDAPLVSGTALTVPHAMPPRPPAVRIGDRVRSLVADVNVTPGLTGLITNTVPPRWGQPARARVVWDNETISIAEVASFEVLPRQAS